MAADDGRHYFLLIFKMTLKKSGKPRKYAGWQESCKMRLPIIFTLFFTKFFVMDCCRYSQENRKACDGANQEH